MPIQKKDGLTKDRAKLILNSIPIIILAFFILIVFFGNNIKADSDLGTEIDQIFFSVKINNKKMKFSVKSYSKDSSEKKYLFYSTLFKTKRIYLSGFEDEINLCAKPVLKVIGGEAICLFGDVGAHSQNLVFVNDDFSLISIINKDIIAQNTVTDTPNYQILDYNNDGIDDFYVDSRNYDKNPIIDMIRDYYRGEKGKFVFDRQEDVEVK